MNSKLKLLFKLLKQNISVWQLCGFIVANLLGGIIVLIGIQAYKDFDRFLNGEQSLLNESYVVISKPITTATTVTSLLGIRPTFSEKEIAELESIPSVSQVGRFNTATFELRGGFMIGKFQISSDMFLESVPAQFLDVKFDSPEEWQADLNSEVVPVILARRYLNLYNYVYASTKGLPQVSEGLTTNIPLSITMSGNGMTATYQARVVGYSDRLNTILVPEEFLKQANAKFSSEAQTQPACLILKTKSGRNDTALLETFKKKGYRVEGNADNLRLQALVNGILYVFIGIGSIVSTLAFFLLLISIQLLIEKNKDKFVNLYSLGYTIRQIAYPYILLVAGVDTLVWLMAITVVSIVYPFLFDFIAVISPGTELASFFPLWGMALGFAAIFALLHRWVIMRQLRRICK